MWSIVSSSPFVRKSSVLAFALPKADSRLPLLERLSMGLLMVAGSGPRPSNEPTKRCASAQMGGCCRRARSLQAKFLCRVEQATSKTSVISAEVGWIQLCARVGAATVEGQRAVRDREPPRMGPARRPQTRSARPAPDSRKTAKQIQTDSYGDFFEDFSLGLCAQCAGSGLPAPTQPVPSRPNPLGLIDGGPVHRPSALEKGCIPALTKYLGTQGREHSSRGLGELVCS